MTLKHRTFSAFSSSPRQAWKSESPSFPRSRKGRIMQALSTLLSFLFFLVPLFHSHSHEDKSLPLLDDDKELSDMISVDPSKLRFLQTTGLTNPHYRYSSSKLHSFLLRHEKHREKASHVDSIEELLIKLSLKQRGRRHNDFKDEDGVVMSGGGEGGGILMQKKVLNFTWPLKKIAVIDGDVWLGGLMMVHEREEEIVCGPIMPQGGIQALETMLFTVDWINNRADFLPGIKIGVHILDDCDKDTYGLEQAVDFIKGSISAISDVAPLDPSTERLSPCDTSLTSAKIIAGVVGAASSVTSIQVANLLRLFKIPQVSFFSTSPELSNKQRFEFFSRTIPSDKNQVQVMVELLKTFGWSYVSIIYEESNYGIKAFEELERLLPENNICIAAKEKLVKDSGVAVEEVYDRIVDKLIGVGEAKGVIVFGSDQEVKSLMRAVARKNATGHFSWIGSDGWSARRLVSDGNEAVVEGTLSVQPRAEKVKGFKEYFFGLNPRNNLRNPWFIEFWEHIFSCRYPNSSRTPYNQGHTKYCTGNEKYNDEDMAFEDQLQYVSDAVMSFAYAISDMHRDLCNGTAGLCSRMSPIDGTELLGYLRKVQFDGLSGDSFHFDEYQDGPARYNIIHFRKKKEGSGYHWTRVGDYNEGVLSLDMSEISFPSNALNNAQPPPSVCSLPCHKGEAKQYFGSDKCCWSCIKCGAYHIVTRAGDTCFECPMGTLPDPDLENCVEIPETYLRINDVWAIFSVTLSSIGILMTLAIMALFIVHSETPVVRASSKELSFLILGGLVGCFGLTFLFVQRPTNFLCGVQLFLTGFVFTIVYAALLVKTNRIARIFKAGRKSAKRPGFISPKSQMVICTGFGVVQVLTSIIHLLVDPPQATHFYPSRLDNFLICRSYINHSYPVTFCYPLVIIATCTVYAVLTRKIPGDFNESKCIGFTMYTTCIIWLAFVPIYWSTGQQVSLRMTSLTVAIALSSYVMIACLFGPKLYIILFHPERNVRASMMPGKGKEKTKEETTFSMRNCSTATNKDEPNCVGRNIQVVLVEKATNTITTTANGETNQEEIGESSGTGTELRKSTSKVFPSEERRHQYTQTEPPSGTEEKNGNGSSSLHGGKCDSCREKEQRIRDSSIPRDKGPSRDPPSSITTATTKETGKGPASLRYSFRKNNRRDSEEEDEDMMKEVIL